MSWFDFLKDEQKEKQPIGSIVADELRSTAKAMFRKAIGCGIITFAFFFVCCSGIMCCKLIVPSHKNDSLVVNGDKASYQLVYNFTETDLRYDLQAHVPAEVLTAIWYIANDHPAVKTITIGVQTSIVGQTDKYGNPVDNTQKNTVIVNEELIEEARKYKTPELFSIDSLAYAKVTVQLTPK